MVITSFEIATVKLISKSKIENIKPDKNGWDLIPQYVIGKNPNNDDILNITIEAIRRKDDKKVSIKTLTCFFLTLATTDTIPSTPHDFELLTLFSQIAFSHTRAMFLIEMKGTIFEKDIIEAYDNTSMLNKIKLAMSLGMN